MTTDKQRCLNEIYFITRVASKTDVNRTELLKLLKQIKKLATIGITK